MPSLRSASPSRARSSGRGFSLIEVIAVMAIISVLGAVAVARSSSLYQSRQRAAAQQLTADLQYIRERAMTTGRSTWAAFAPASDTVTYTETVSGAPVTMIDPATNKAFLTKFHTSSDGQNYYGVRIGTINGSAANVTLGFDWQGRPLTGAAALQTVNQVITITATIGATTFANVTITINAETGLVFFTP